MTTGDITREAMSRGLLKSCKGKTPDATMASALYSEVKTNGPRSTFVRPRAGHFGLREWQDHPELRGLVSKGDGLGRSWVPPTERHKLWKRIKRHKTSPAILPTDDSDDDAHDELHEDHHHLRQQPPDTWGGLRLLVEAVEIDCAESGSNEGRCGQAPSPPSRVVEPMNGDSWPGLHGSDCSPTAAAEEEDAATTGDEAEPETQNCSPTTLGSRDDEKEWKDCKDGKEEEHHCSGDVAMSQDVDSHSGHINSGGSRVAPVASQEALSPTSALQLESIVNTVTQMEQTLGFNHPLVGQGYLFLSRVLQLQGTLPAILMAQAALTRVYEIFGNLVGPSNLQQIASFQDFQYLFNRLNQDLEHYKQAEQQQPTKKDQSNGEDIELGKEQGDKEQGDKSTRTSSIE